MKKHSLKQINRVTGSFMAVLLTLVMALSFSAVALAEDEDGGAAVGSIFVVGQDPLEISVIVNGELIAFDQAPQNINGRTMVPIRLVVEKLGCVVEWDEGTQTVYINEPDVELEKLAEKTANINVFVNNEQIDFPDQQPVIVGDRTLLPVRFVVEKLNCTVGWDGDLQIVYVTSQAPEVPEVPEVKSEALEIAKQLAEKVKGTDAVAIGIEKTAEVPETEVPETEAPETEAPEAEAPETEAPEAEAPEAEAPEAEAPEVAGIIEEFAKMIGADDAASFKVGDDKFGVYHFSEAPKILDAVESPFTIEKDDADAIKLNFIIKGNWILASEAANEAVTAAFNELDI